MVQAMKEKIFTVIPESLGCNAECKEFEVGELGYHPAPGDIFGFIYSISGETLIDWILTKFTMKLRMSRQIAVVGAVTTNSLKNLHIAQLFH